MRSTFAETVSIMARSFLFSSTRYCDFMNKKGWYVITGGPFAGKTTLLNALQELGLNTEAEIARLYIDEEIAKGKTISEIRNDEATFQYAVHERKLLQHAHLPKESLIFFDRGLPDTIAYLRASNLPITPKVEKTISQYPYRKVFLLDLVGHTIDHARTESYETARRIQKELYRAYQELDLPILKVPFMSLKDRIKFVLDNL